MYRRAMLMGWERNEVSRRRALREAQEAIGDLRRETFEVVAVVALLILGVLGALGVFG